MAKQQPAALTDDALFGQSAPLPGMKQRAVAVTPERVPSADLVGLSFRMPPAFVKQFKAAALERDMKLNEFLQFLFSSFQENKKAN